MFLGIILVLIADFFWGFGFIATVWALESIPPFLLTTLRMSLAFLIGIPFLMKFSWETQKKLFLTSISAGILLSLLLCLQTIGLKYTTPSKSGFITTLYVILIPIIEQFIYGKKISLTVWGCAITAVLGIFLICKADLTHVNLGDFLTFICAIVAALHIILVGRITHSGLNPFALNLYQCFTGSLLALMFALLARESFPETLPFKAAFGLGSLTILSTLLGFGIQIYAQKYISATLASLLFLMESPLASFFSYIFMGEVLSGIQLIGAAVVIVSAALAIYSESKRQIIIV